MTAFTAIVVCFNEAKHLEECLRSLSFCDELLVFDMGSTDLSKAIAKNFANKVNQIPRVDAVESIWESLINEAKNDWIILQDPDEVFPMQLSMQLQEEIKARSDIGLFSIPIRYFYKGAQLNSTIWGGLKYKSKTFNRQRVRISPEVHGGVQVKPGYLGIKISCDPEIYIKHFWVDNLHQLVKKHWRYIKSEGKARYNKGQRFTLKRMCQATYHALIENLISKHGYKDGNRGIFLSFFYALYVLMSNLSLLSYQISISKKKTADSTDG